MSCRTDVLYSDRVSTLFREMGKFCFFLGVLVARIAEPLTFVLLSDASGGLAKPNRSVSVCYASDNTCAGRSVTLLTRTRVRLQTGAPHLTHRTTMKITPLPDTRIRGGWAVTELQYICREPKLPDQITGNVHNLFEPIPKEWEANGHYEGCGGDPFYACNLVLTSEHRRLIAGAKGGAHE